MTEKEPLFLRIYPDPILREKAVAVGEPDADLLERVVPEMFRIMKAAKGIGLAAPQAGVSRRIVVAQVAFDPDLEPRDEVYIDPVITGTDGKVREDEGCLSFPGMFSPVDRFEEVTVAYTRPDGLRTEVTVEGMHAKLFQHEIDHLDGMLMIDRMSPAELKRWGSFLKELEKEYASGNRSEASSQDEAPPL